jgi:hypothetical protein
MKPAFEEHRVDQALEKSADVIKHPSGVMERHHGQKRTGKAS